jgi:membrane protein required for colicin V production
MDAPPALFDALSRLGWVDWSLLTVLAVSVVLGLARGFVFELMALAGWVVAWMAAQWFTPAVQPHFEALAGLDGSGPRLAAFVAVFAGTLLAWSLLARAVKLLLHATPLSVPDRVLGAGFGVLRGAVLLLVLATVVGLTPAAQSQAWRASHGAHWLVLSLQAARPLLPQAAHHVLPP